MKFKSRKGGLLVGLFIAVNSALFYIFTGTFSPDDEVDSDFWLPHIIVLFTAIFINWIYFGTSYRLTGSQL